MRKLQVRAGIVASPALSAKQNPKSAYQFPLPQ